MSAEGNTLQKQIGLWTLLGPFIFMTTLVILLITPLRQPLYIPLIGLAAVPTCWKWSLKGLYAALGGLFAAFMLQLYFMPAERVFWDLLLTLATGLTITITTLGGLEVKDLLFNMQQESSSRLQDFLGINARIQLLEEQKLSEVSTAQAKADLLQKKLSEESARLQALEKNATISREKLANISTQNESLLRELFQKRHECDKLTQQLHTQTSEVEALLSSQKQTESLFDEQADLLNKLQTELAKSAGESERCRQSLQEAAQAAEAKQALLEQQIEQLQQQLTAATSKESDWQQLEKRYQEDLAALHQELDSLRAKAEAPAGKPSEPELPPTKPKSKSAKGSKTNNWANAILSRWSESDDPSQ